MENNDVKVLSKEEMEKGIKDAAINWLTGGEPDTNTKILSEKINTNDAVPFGYFLAKSESSLIVLYVWYTLFGQSFQVSQETSFALNSTDNKDELFVAEYMFNTLTRRM